MQELISQIKGLKQIQPEKSWVKATKSQILTDIHQEPVVNFDWLSSRSALILPVVIFFIAVGSFFYNKNVLYPEMASVDLEILDSISFGLRSAETDIIKTTVNLENIEKAKTAVEVQEMVKSTLENGEKVLVVARKMAEQPEVVKRLTQIFAAMNGVEYATENLEYALDDMEEAYWTKQKDLAKALIEDFETKALTQEQELLLQEAKNYYNESRYSEALAKVIEISR